MTGESKSETVLPDIIDFYTGRTVFITGATGFLGKVLLEKLLRSCKGIEEIFVLIRPSLLYDANDKLNKLLENKIFDRIRQECPDVLEKLVPISGDISRPDLEMEESELQLVYDSVSLVFHAAATVKFDETPRKCLDTNLLGTKNLLDICHKMEHLVALVYVSTAYSFCNFNEIMEYLYPERIQPEQVLSMLEWMPDSLLKKTLNHILNGRPYIYHFSKAMAEIYLDNNKKELPMCIIRPSMITAAWQEPFPGWIDSYTGPSGMIAACGKGIVRSVYVNPSLVADMVPVDIVVNTIIAAAREVAVNRPSSVMIANCTTPKTNKLTWSELESICYPLIVKYPSIQLFRHPGGSFKSNYFRHQISILKSHLLPAYFTDTFCYIFLPSLAMTDIYSRVHRLMSQFEFFTTTSIKFQSENKKKLWNEMSINDKNVFPFDMADFSWHEYMEDYVLGVRRYLLREDDETLPQARAKMVRSYYLWLTIKAVPLIFGLWYIQRRTNIISLNTMSYFRSLLPKFSLPV